MYYLNCFSSLSYYDDPDVDVDDEDEDEDAKDDSRMFALTVVWMRWGQDRNFVSVAPHWIDHLCSHPNG